jgi:hypothetical protein
MNYASLETRYFKVSSIISRVIDLSRNLQTILYKGFKGVLKEIRLLHIRNLQKIKYPNYRFIYPSQVRVGKPDPYDNSRQFISWYSLIKSGSVNPLCEAEKPVFWIGA